MKNIFSQTKDYVEQPKRNVFDLSFQNNGTYNFGTLYPVFCKEVIPGDSFQIDTSFALRFMPTAFPVQTKITANLHFFYVRNRNLWENWRKFIGHTGECEFPFIDANEDFFKTGSLADHLGIPTTRVGDYASNYNITHFNLYPFTSGRNALYISRDQSNSSDWDKITHVGNPSNTPAYVPSVCTEFVSAINYPIDRVPDFIDLSVSGIDEYGDTESEFLESVSPRILIGYRDSSGVIHGIGSYDPVNMQLDQQTSGDIPSYKWRLSTSPIQSNPITLKLCGKTGTESSVSFSTYDDFNDYVVNAANGNKIIFAVYDNQSNSHFPVKYFNVPLPHKFFIGTMILGFPVALDRVTDLSSLPALNNPFMRKQLKLSALPFRAYESIYNAFYRNELNDPLMVDGKPEYDVYVPNTSDGADQYPYKLYQRNWELDFLTSAVQSPQQGIAPLVGVSQQGDFTFAHKDSDGNIGYFSAKANISDDGKTITGFTLSDRVQLDGVPLTDVTDVPENVKRGSVYTLNQMALAGISINDFRNVNALQRWLETNIRRGYKYADQIKSHFGVDVAYNVLDMPEFIGGISEPVFANQVNQTSETESDPLGSYAGQLSLMASSDHSVKHYCDEHGFIIGILSVVPVPNYSQLLPKHYLKSNYLDFYFPEFAHIGMQPIDYREVCPIQVYSDDPQKLNNTFGYQRPWYDYIASVDEVHGLFRTNLRNFVLNRQFDTFPALNKEFLQVDPSQLNDIFTVEESDKILGQIKFNVIAKRPIPKFGIPRLE